MAAIRWQLVDTAHDQLPFLTVGLNPCAEHLMRHQVRHLMSHGLAQEVFGVLAVELFVETQQILLQVSHAGLLAAQLQAHLGAGEAALEKLLGQRVAGFDAGIETLGH